MTLQWKTHSQKSQNRIAMIRRWISTGNNYAIEQRRYKRSGREHWYAFYWHEACDAKVLIAGWITLPGHTASRGGAEYCCEKHYEAQLRGAASPEAALPELTVADYLSIGRNCLLVANASLVHCGQRTKGEQLRRYKRLQNTLAEGIDLVDSVRNDLGELVPPPEVTCGLPPGSGGLRKLYQIVQAQAGTGQCTVGMSSMSMPRPEQP